MSAFDLKASPFYALGVSPRDRKETIAEVAEQAVAEGTLDESTALRAQQTLMSLRPRLAAEVAWLSGIAPNRARSLIETAAIAEDAAVDLPPLAAANLGAHRCSAGLEPSFSDTILDFYAARDLATILEILNSERRASGFPAITPELLNEAAPQLARQHAAALLEWIERRPEPGRVLVDIVEKRFDGPPEMSAILDELVDGFDSRAIAALREAESTITECVEDIRNDSTALDHRLPVFASAVAAWSSAAGPRQYGLARRHLKDERSETLFALIRILCLDLHNDRDDSATALAIAKAALPAFEKAPEYLARFESDIETLEKHVSGAAARQTMRPLDAFIAGLKSHRALCNTLKLGYFRDRGMSEAGELFRLFKEAALALKGESGAMAPFEAVYSVAITLHNESGASAEAQFTCNSFSGGQVSVKFDDRAVERFPCTKPSDGSSNIIFIENSKRFLADLQRSSKVTIEAEFFQEGERQLTFSIAGLEWK